MAGGNPLEAGEAVRDIGGFGVMVEQHHNAETAGIGSRVCQAAVQERQHGGLFFFRALESGTEAVTEGPVINLWQKGADLLLQGADRLRPAGDYKRMQQTFLQGIVKVRYECDGRVGFAELAGQCMQAGQAHPEHAGAGWQQMCGKSRIGRLGQCQKLLAQRFVQENRSFLFFIIA